MSAYILLGAGALALAMQDHEDGTPAVTVPVSTTPPVGSRPIPVADVAQRPPAINVGSIARQLAGGSLYRTPTSVTPGGGNWTTQDATARDQALQYAEKEVKKQYDALTKAGKKRGAEYLNATLDPSPNLTGDETFDEANKKIGASIGGAAGGAGCAAYPPTAAAAPLCAYLGAIVGGYLGEELGPYLKKGWNAVEDFASDVGEGIKDIGKGIYDNSIGRLF